MLSDIKVRSLDYYLVPQIARTPLKFGAVVVDEVDLCRVKAVVENRRGEVAEGWGAILIMDFWGWPDPALPHATKAAAMKEVARGFGDLVLDWPEYAHPIELFHEVEPGLRSLNQRVCADRGLAPTQPFLGALVCASPIDAAIHDAFGNANGIDTYQGCGSDFMRSDLSRWLGPEFAGKWPGDYVRESYQPSVPVFHLCGGLDKLRRSEVDDTDPQDELPNSLDDWIQFDGLYCLKIKLRGTDMAWDLERILDVHSIARAELARVKENRLHITLDTNEQCESPAYMEELLSKVRQRSADCYDRVLYVEQPTGRDLAADRHDMRRLAAMKPVIVDESLVDMETMDLALELGWSGIALKSCKCQSSDALFWSKATQLGVPYSVQDLTNPSLALLHSVGLAARLTTILGVEANSRQFFPRATQFAEKGIHTGITRIRGGEATTASLCGTGLGYQMDRMDALGWTPGPPA